MVKYFLFDYKKMERCRRMSVIHVILSIIYVILGVAISVVILMQEGALEHFTRYGAIAFMLITIALNVLLKVMG